MFPDTVAEKDINEMILGGKSESEILDIINTNTFSGIEAKLKFVDWRKV
jgi:DNA-binding CsgD family transcriptional regulator